MIQQYLRVLCAFLNLLQDVQNGLLPGSQSYGEGFPMQVRYDKMMTVLSGYNSFRVSIDLIDALSNLKQNLIKLIHPSSDAGVVIVSGEDRRV